MGEVFRIMKAIVSTVNKCRHEVNVLVTTGFELNIWESCILTFTIFQQNNISPQRLLVSNTYQNDSGHTKVARSLIFTHINFELHMICNPSLAVDTFLKNNEFWGNNSHRCVNRPLELNVAFLINAFEKKYGMRKVRILETTKHSTRTDLDIWQKTIVSFFR